MIPFPQKPDAPSIRDTVVLLHASGSSARQWNPLADALRPTHDVHAIDFHGHGRRAPWTATRPFSLHDDMALALDVLERAGGGFLVGHSYGGAIAMHLAATRPGLVRGLAVYEPVLLHLLASLAPESAGSGEALAVAARIRRAVEEGDGHGAAEPFVDYWSGAGTWRRMDPMQQGAIASRMATVVAHFDTLYREPLPPGMRSRMTMPLLVLRGSRTTNAACAVAGMLQRLLPDAEHAAMAGLGHMAPLTHAGLVNDRLLGFLRDARGRMSAANDDFEAIGGRPPATAIH